MTCHAETCFLIVINAVQTEIESGGSCMFDGVVLLKKSTGNVSRPRVTRSLSMDTTTYSIFFIQKIKSPTSFVILILRVCPT